MRTLFFAVATATAALAFSPATAQQNPIYGWCAQYEEGGTNCGFTSLSQCQQALSGNGGFCDRDQTVGAAPLTTSSIPLATSPNPPAATQQRRTKKQAKNT